MRELLTRSQGKCFLGFDRHAAGLRRTPGATERLLEILVQEVEDPLGKVGEEAAIALARMGDAGVSLLVQRLAHEDDGVGWCARHGLLRGAGEFAVPALCAEARQVEPVRALAALGTLARFGRLAREAVPHLRPLLHADKQVREEAALALAHIGYADEETCRVLVAALQGASWMRSEEILAGIASLGPAAAACAPFLRAAASDGPLDLRILHARALWAVSGDSEEALEVYLQGLRSGDWDTVDDATIAIGQLGPAGRKAIRELIDLRLAEPSPGTSRTPRFFSLAIYEVGLSQDDFAAVEARLGAAEPVLDRPYLDFLGNTVAPDAFLMPRILDALDRADSKGRQELLHSLLLNNPRLDARLALRLAVYAGDADAELRSTAVMALIHVGERAAAAVPALRRYLGDASRPDRDMFASALCVLGPDARQALPELVAALESEEPRLALEAAIALGCIAPLPESAVQALRRTSSRAGGDLALACAHALCRHDPLDGGSHAAVVRALEDERTCEIAVRLLQWRGPEARDALPALERVVDASLYELAVNAARAMRIVGGDPQRALERATRMYLMEKDAGGNLTFRDYFGFVEDLGPLARGVHPLLRRYLREFHPDCDARKRIRMILGS